MDRRRFLAAGSLAATVPLLAGAGASARATATAGPGRSLFQRIDFTGDGLGLDPLEYATRLQEMAADDAFLADNYSLGGAVARLERTFANLLGKPAAMFVPTGTLANLLAVRRLAGGDRRVLVQAESHLFNDSGDGAQLLAGLNLVPLAPGQATLPLRDVQAWVERSRGGRVRNDVGVISIETPVRRLDHVAADFAELERVSRYARSEGIRLHLDGARLFALPQHSGRPLRAYTALFDTVYVSLWKHFNGAGGAILAGSEDVIEGLFHERRMFGGALPAAWPQLALVEASAAGFQDDYALAWRRAEALLGILEASGRFGARRLEGGSVRFFLSVRDADPSAFVQRIREQGIRMAMPVPDSGEIPLQVNATLLRTAPEALARGFMAALSA